MFVHIHVTNMCIQGKASAQNTRDHEFMSCSKYISLKWSDCFECPVSILSWFWLSTQCCRIAKGQRCVKKLTDMQLRSMIRHTAKPAVERRRDILEKASYDMQYIPPSCSKTALCIVIEPSYCRLGEHTCTYSRFQLLGSTEILY